MEGGRGCISHHDVASLFGMMESPDPQAVESVKCLIHENLAATKEVWLIHGLLDYYIAVQSSHALDVIIRIREPHDKHLFDRMVEYLKNENTRYHCLLLLSHVIHRQPSWLFRITQNRIFQVLLNLLKTEVDPPCLMCALFSIVSLLPMIPSQIGSYLNDIFEIFSRLVAWSCKKSIGIPEVFILHLQVGVYALFHRLYGMYPCNFLSYLRSYYGGREYKEENIRVFASTIRPMLEKVRLHPLLVTACKESEISQKRWKRMATHDIVALCASISLDAIEGTPEDIHCGNTGFGRIFTGRVTQSQENSMQYFSFSSMSSTVSTNAECDSIANKYDTSWTPSRICSLSTPPPESAMMCSSFEERRHESQGGDSQSGVTDDGDIGLSGSTNQETIETRAEVPAEKKKLPVFVAEAMEAKEEDLVDKEVSELTSMPPVSNEPAETRHDTPFRSTTQNLTDQAEFGASENLADSRGEEVIGEESGFDIESELEMERLFVQSIENRLRYLSHRGATSDVPNEFFMQSLRLKARSCPNIDLCGVTVPSTSHSQDVPEHTTENDSQISPAQNDCHAKSFWSDAVSGQNANLPETPYDHLIAMALHPLALGEKACADGKSSQSEAIKNPDYAPFYSSFSPSELLDRYVQLGTEAHLAQLDTIPLTSTRNADWTHFGGKPPAEELKTLHIQVKLLHLQVMFERQRREIHAERNRRLLGKVKRSQIQDENIATLKDQVYLLEKEKNDMQSELEVHMKRYQQLESEKHQSEKDFCASIQRMTQEFGSLQFSNRTLQTLLVTQKQENDVLKTEAEAAQSQLVDLTFENEVMQNEISHLRNVEAECMWLSKENLLLKELNEHNSERFNYYAREQYPADYGSDLAREALCAEHRQLKQDLDYKIALIDALRCRVTALEEENTFLKTKLTDQASTVEHLKSLHKDEVKVIENRLTDLQETHFHYTTRVLDLYNEITELKAKEDACTCGNRLVPEDADANDVPNDAVDAGYDMLDAGYTDLPVQNSNNNQFESPTDHTALGAMPNSGFAANGTGNFDSA